MYGISRMIGAALAGIAANDAALFQHVIPMSSDFKRPKRRVTGKKYPHSSARQQARYARQIAAGQIKFAA